MGEHALRALLKLDGFLSQTIDTSVGAVRVLRTETPGAAGPPLILVHGFGASGLQLTPLARGLRGAFRRVLVPDLPGHGFSAQPTSLDADSLTRGTIEALDALSLPPAILFGNSMGGLAAARFAALRPERVRGLVLCSPGGAPVSEAELPDFKQIFQLNSHAEALAFVDGLFGRPHPLRQPIALGVRRRLREPQLVQLMGSVNPASMFSPEELARIQAPTLLIWGDRDGILPKHHRDFFEQHLPAGRQLRFPPDLGHSPALGDTDKLVSWITTFAEGITQSPSQE